MESYKLNLLNVNFVVRGRSLVARLSIDALLNMDRLTVYFNLRRINSVFTSYVGWPLSFFFTFSFEVTS